MLVKMAYNMHKNGFVYHAIICTDTKGRVIFSETRELNPDTREGKYWEHLRLLKRVLHVLENIVDVPATEHVTIALNSTVLCNWIETGARKPYKFAVEEILNLLQSSKFEDIELVAIKKTINNPAVRLASPDCIKTENLQSVVAMFT